MYVPHSGPLCIGWYSACFNSCTTSSGCLCLLMVSVCCAPVGRCWGGVQGLHREAPWTAGTLGWLPASTARAQTWQRLPVRTEPLPCLQESASNAVAFVPSPVWNSTFFPPCWDQVAWIHPYYQYSTYYIYCYISTVSYYTIFTAILVQYHIILYLLLY